MEVCSKNGKVSFLFAGIQRYVIQRPIFKNSNYFTILMITGRMEPGDVRKLSEIEVLKGLQGPTQPITQHDFDNPGRGDNRFESGVRRGPATFRGDLMSNVKGTGGPRNRRQDRIQRGQAGDFFGRTEDERRREERNWDRYKENKRGKDGVVADDEWQYRPGSAVSSNNDWWALGDSDSQWGRQPSQRQQQKERRQHKNDRSNDDDWGKFVSPASAPGPAEEDDFFNSLMSDLSKDLNTGEKGPKGARPAQDSTTSATESEEDDFFASLMAEIAPEAENESSNNGESDSSMFVDDFFFSLASSSQEEDDKGEKSEGVDSIFDEDDFFKSFDVGSGDSSKDKSMDSDDMFDILDIEREQSSEERASVASEADDFFASLEEELGNALEERESSRSSLNDSDDDFFASLEEEVSSKLEASSEVEKDKVAPKAEKEQSQPKAQKANRAKSLNPGDLESMKVPELKEMLRERGLKVSGKKAELIERLTQ